MWGEKGLAVLLNRTVVVLSHYWSGRNETFVTRDREETRFSERVSGNGPVPFTSASELHSLVSSQLKRAIKRFKRHSLSFNVDKSQL